jgi:hypothetical protein
MKRPTTMAVAMRIPYQRMTTGPIWTAMAPGELNTTGRIARRLSPPAAVTQSASVAGVW